MYTVSSIDNVKGTMMKTLKSSVPRGIQLALFVFSTKVENGLVPFKTGIYKCTLLNLIQKVTRGNIAGNDANIEEANEIRSDSSQAINLQNLRWKY